MLGIDKGGHILLVSVVNNGEEGEKTSEKSCERTFQLGNVDPLPK